MKKTIEVEVELLNALAELVPSSSKTTLRQMLQRDRVRVNGAVVKDAKRQLVKGDQLEIASRAMPSLLPPELNILFEDEHIVVVDKAAGLLTVATERERDATVQNYLNKYLYHSAGSRERIHVVHRLDRDTSGVLVFAKSFAIREKLKNTFAAHDIERVYHAIVEGTMEKSKGTFKSILVEDEDTYQVKSVEASEKGKLAVTHYKVLQAGKRYSYLEVTLETGRKNQIRVHLSEAGHPVVGDERYGATTNPLKRLGLHAHVLGFKHPMTRKAMRFTSPIPDAFRSLKL